MEVREVSERSEWLVRVEYEWLAGTDCQHMANLVLVARAMFNDHM